MIKKRTLNLRVPGIAFVVMLISTLNAHAQNDQKSWHQVRNHADCKYLHLVNEHPKLPRWTGKCANGFVQGQGTITFETELGTSKITGVYEDGIVSGYIEVNSWVLKDGETHQYEYKGEAKKGNMTGRGTLKVGDFFNFSGQFKNAQPHGYGDLKAYNYSYSGTFKDNAYDGLGVFQLEGRPGFKGVFKNGKADGPGVLEIHVPNKNFKLRIVGTFKGHPAPPFDDFEVIGPAIMESEGEDQYRYIGNISDLYMHGQGVQVLDTGFRHEGMFEKGLRHGPGISIDPNGNSCEGEWKQGLLTGTGEGLHQGRSTTCQVDEDNEIVFIK
ncbi:hypothetical protein ACFL12_02350 [Pseudomonadota bacterium]